MKLIAHPWDRANRAPGTQLQEQERDRLLPCAQPMDPLTKHLAWGFGILVMAVVLAVNMPHDPPAPLACSSTTQTDK